MERILRESLSRESGMRVGIEMSYDPRSVNESDNQVINDRSLPSIGGIMMILRVESLRDFEG